MLLVIAAWVVLQRFILPKMGVPTWMAPACRLQDEETEKTKHGKSVIDERNGETLNADIWVQM